MNWMRRWDASTATTLTLERSSARGRSDRSDEHGRVLLTQRASSKRIFPKAYDTSASFHVAYGESYRGESIVLDPTEAMAGRFHTRSQAEYVALHAPCTPWLVGAFRLLAEADAW
jgi:hypothetical protein